MRARRHARHTSARRSSRSGSGASRRARRSPGPLGRAAAGVPRAAPDSASVRCGGGALRRRFLRSGATRRARACRGWRPAAARARRRRAARCRGACWWRRCPGSPPARLAPAPAPRAPPRPARTRSRLRRTRCPSEPRERGTRPSGGRRLPRAASRGSRADSAGRRRPGPGPSGIVRSLGSPLRGSGHEISGSIFYLRAGRKRTSSLEDSSPWGFSGMSALGQRPRFVDQIHRRA